MVDAADRDPGGHSHGHRTSLLPLKKRASNYTSGPGKSSAGDAYVSWSSKKKRVQDVSISAETKDTAGALDGPVPRQRRSVPAAPSREPAAEAELVAAAAAPPEPTAKGNASSESDEEKKRLSKGREESRVTLTPQPPPPPVKKLMHDGIRSQQLRDEHRRHAEADDDVPLPLHGSGSPALSAALERRLAKLGATRPWLVHSKTLSKSDVDENQNRLLVSRKRVNGTEGCPITRCFSPDELERVNVKIAKEEPGLCVTALDRDGVPYEIACKFLGSNSGYRFIAEWKDFLARNGLNLNSQRHRLWTRDVEVELWAFRSRLLPFQPLIGADRKAVTVTGVDENGKKVTVTQRISHHLDPDGALGLLLLHHENRRRRVIKSDEEGEADGDWKEPSSRPSVARKKGKQKSGKRGASASASALALPAPVAEQQGGVQRSSEPVFYAAIGLEKLRRAIWEQWKEHVNRENGAKGLSNDVAKSPADMEGEKIGFKK